jgi:hypothetical protein
VRANTHWLLFLIAIVSGGVVIAFSRTGGSLPCIAAGWTFLLACVLLAVLERLDGEIPLGAPRTVGWVLVLLTASFVPLVSISGAWGDDESSLLMLPGTGGTLISWVAVPWLIVVGDQPQWRTGRASPMLLAWLGTAINLAVTMG